MLIMNADDDGNGRDELLLVRSVLRQQSWRGTDEQELVPTGITPAPRFDALVCRPPAVPFRQKPLFRLNRSSHPMI
jgi:hypothetical protein